MSIDLFVSAAQSQASSVATKSQADQQAYENMIQALQQFVDEERLNSAAYTNGKQFFSTVLIPLVQAGILLSEAVGTACQKFVDDYQATVDSGDLKSEELEEKIQQLDLSISNFEAIRATIEQSTLGDNVIIRQLDQNSRTIETLNDTKKILQEKLEKLLAFHASSPEIFANIAGLEALVNQGASQAEGAWTGSGFSIPTDLQWTTTVADKWQIRAENIRKQEQAVHEAKIKELKQYKVYAVVYYDQAGQPKIMWQLEKDGKGVTNPELYRYLEQTGTQLTPDLFEFIDYSSWEEKVQNGWKNGYNYITGETYNPLLGGLVATSQYLEDGVTWLNESELGVAIQTLGFTYASYRMMTKNGLVTVESEKASGAKKIYNANGNPDLRALRRAQFDEALKNGFPDGTKLNQHAYNSLFKSGRKDIMIDDIIDALNSAPIPAKPGSVEYINPKTNTSVFVNPTTKEVVGIWPASFKK
jgi:hypothetical protein